MSLTPVNPGEPLRPKFTAEWYNHTLRSSSPQEDSRAKRSYKILREGELHCLAEDSTASQFEPVFVTGLANTDATGPRTPTVASTPADEHDWVIPQQDMREDALVLCVTFGLTKAWVTTTRTQDKCVVYDPDNSILRTAKEGKAQILVKGDTQYPSLINIGVQSQCIRIVGTLRDALLPTYSTVTIDDLRGVNFYADAIGTSLAAYNRHRFEADAGAVVSAEWTMDPGRWEIYQVDCPA